MNLPGDQARATVLVEVDPPTAFRVFTEEIDEWWRRGSKYRVSGKNRGVMCIEAGVGGRLFETIDTKQGTKMVETGRVKVWDPPHRFVFDWRAVNFAPDEKTEVEVEFKPSPSGTTVTVTHRGWATIRPDHPARHGHEVPEFVAMMGHFWGDLLMSLRNFASA